MIKTLFKASSKDIVYFRNLGNRQTILEIITEAKKELIAGLRSVEDIEGWHDPTMESAQSLWTCVEVCKSLIEAGEPIRNLDGVLEKLQKEVIEVDELKGWESESIPGAISTYLTSDIGLLYQSIGRYKELQTVLATLNKMQNSDGGWGVCSGDQTSKTRATCFVILLYAKCLNSPWAYNLIDWNSYTTAIDWLTKAQNDNDGGWGNMSDLMPSDVAATSFAINAILSSKISLRKHPDFKLPIRDSVIALGIKRLIQMEKNGSWRGVMEDLGIKLATAYHGSFRHTTSGVGTLLTLQALCKASRLGYISEDQNIIALGLDDILRRCSKYSGANGKWIVPSDQNGPPTAWNSAFALDAFLEFQRLYLEFHTRGIVDTGLTSKIIARERIWKSITVVFASILFFLLFAPRVTVLQIYVNWFNSQAAWTQGIIITFVGILTERIISFTVSIITNKISKDKKKWIE